MKGTIVILHGWGSLVSGQKRFWKVKEILESKGYTVFTPDLPGFGENTLQKEALTFEDYVSYVGRFVKKVMNQTKVKKIILIGHSFGGRIAIRFTAQHPKLIDKLILTGASGIVRPLSFRKKIIAATAKIIKPLTMVYPFRFFFNFLRKIIYYFLGEMDYYKSGNLAQTFKNVYRVSIKNDLPHIPSPTLLLWGENDTMTPLRDGQYMSSHIQKSKLIVIPSATHKLPYENPSIFTKEVIKFLS